MKKPINKLLNAAMLGFALAIAIFAPVACSAQMIAKETVTPSEPFSKVTSGLVQDTIFDGGMRQYLIAGDCVINKDNTIITNAVFVFVPDSTVIKLPKKGSVNLIGVQAKNVTFENCTFVGNTNFALVSIIESVNTKFVNCHFQGKRNRAILWTASQGLQVSKCYFDGECVNENITGCPGDPAVPPTAAKERGLIQEPMHKWSGGTNLGAFIGNLDWDHTFWGDGTNALILPYDTKPWKPNGGPADYLSDAIQPFPLSDWKVDIWGPGLNDIHRFTVKEHNREKKYLVIEAVPRWDNDKPIFQKDVKYGYWIDRPAAYNRNAVIEDCIFDGNYKSNSSAISMYFVNGIALRRNIFAGWGDMGPSLEQCKNFIIEDNISYDNQRFGIHRQWDQFETVGYCENGLIRNNVGTRFALVAWSVIQRKIVSDQSLVVATNGLGIGAGWVEYTITNGPFVSNPEPRTPVMRPVDLPNKRTGVE